MYTKSRGKQTTWPSQSLASRRSVTVALGSWSSLQVHTWADSRKALLGPGLQGHQVPAQVFCNQSTWESGPELGAGLPE